ncbi:hypothetical protein SPE26_32015 [Bacillus thuringiensis]|uniref:hypothetical protein n=1 Tax=Bacillus thuringiensis TaxID=1428 RepID=UPI002A6AB7D6|nr:hypothetical protein [Bacillus thuringiensis]MDY4395250.1 hypothetical protein [Bacillus thuringiensis]
MIVFIYSGGNLEAQGRYIAVVEDKNKLFLCWRKHNRNEVYTNLNGISVETMNENTAYLQNSRDTCARGHSDTYDQNMDTTYQPSYDNYNQNASGTYDDRYN